MDTDPNKIVYEPIDLETRVPALIASMGPEYQKIIMRDGESAVSDNSREIFMYRFPGPATDGDGKFGKGIFLYKGLGDRILDIHRRANEVGGMLQAAQWGQDGRHQHCRIPRLFDSFTDYPRDGTPPTKPLYIASEFLHGTHYESEFRKDGCIGWTCRQKRRFVRQLALFRLSMIHMRSNRIGGLMPDGTFGLMPYHAVCHRWVGGGEVALPGGGKAVAAGFYVNLDAVDSEQEWCREGIARETAYWNDRFNEVFMHILMIQQRSVFQWDADSFKNHFNHRAQAHIGRKYRQTWEELDAPNADFPFCFDHGDLHHGFNLMCHKNTPRIDAVIDWETSMFTPYSFSVKDINPAKFGLGDWDAELGNIRQDDMPFEADMIWDHELAFWRRESNKRKEAQARRTERAHTHKRKVSTMNDNNYAAYGKLTIRDLLFGDTLDDPESVDEPPDDPDPFYCEGLLRFNNNTDWEAYQPNTWFYGPVMKLMDEFLQNEMHISKLCKFRDPFLEMWTHESSRLVQPP